MTPADHERRRAHHLADHAVIDEPAAGLQPRAQERIRRAAQHQSLFLSQLHKFDAFFKRRAQGLFAVHMFSSQ